MFESSAEKELKREEEVALSSLERYSGSKPEEFQPFILLTNFPRYVDSFMEQTNGRSTLGSMFRVAHSEEHQISIIDFKIGSAAAALIMDLLAFLPVQGCLLLGMCGGLRRRYKVGEFFVPVAAIRTDGTSDFYFPPYVPALANFLVQKAVTNVLEEKEIPYHIGISHHTNIRFWEFKKEFVEHVKASRAQAIEMECATLFTAGYRYKVPLGSLLLISDLPLDPDGVKTKESAREVFEKHTAEHVERGMDILHHLKTMPKLKQRLGRGQFGIQDTFG